MLFSGALLAFALLVVGVRGLLTVDAANAAETPHRTFTTNSDACASCHAVHGAATATGLMRDTGGVGAPGEVTVCYACHDGQGANANVRTGSTDSFALSSGHEVEDTATGGDLTNRCSSCHDAHGDPSTDPMVPAKTINGNKVSGRGVQWCLACHDDKNTWYGSGYPSTSAPTRNAAGYPVSGVFPGASTYTSASDAHFQIPETTQTAAAGEPIKREKGDCLYCHTAHRGPSTYDGLRADFRPSSASTLASDQASGAYGGVCLTCHGGVTPSGFATAPVDVKQFITAPSQTAGHRVKTAGGTLPVGSPLPCYECHNPHGSKRGNASMITDERGADLKTDTASGVREFCFTCHTTADTTNGWDSTVKAYAAPDAADKVVGLSRSAGVLKLPARAGHNEGDTQSCYSCHGNDYSTAGGSNVHNPGTGGGNHIASAVSQECLDCHQNPDISTLHTGGCATCHGNPNYPSLPTGKAPECVSCHDGVTVGTHPYSPPATNHYDETTHTATPFTAAYQGTGAAGTVNAFGKECSNCHSSTLPQAHSSTSTSSGSVTCAECHTNTSLGAKTVIANKWPDKRCTDCHDSGSATTHANAASAHVVDAGQCGGTGPSCHNSLDLAQLHDTSQSGGTPKYASCANADPNDPTSCHNVRDARPAPFNKSASCGAGTSGCHQDKTPTHATGGAHAFSSASDYSNATITGCTNSGAGCHGSETTHSNFTDYHPTTGCLGGACHTSPSKATYMGNGDCATCHAGTFTNAPNVDALTSATPNGHYGDATHTADALSTVVSAGGTASATCSNCHNPTNLSGVDGLYNQHQGLPAPYQNTTCYDCHNKNVNVTAVVTSKWPTKACAACHTSSVLPGLEEHATSAPVVPATSVGTYAGRSCVSAGCHTTSDLHELHKDAAGGCAITGCHDFNQQAFLPSAKSCGTTGTCHTGAEPHTNLAAAHDGSAEPMAQPGTDSSTNASLPANSSAAVSCQNNPNGTECHVVSDVAALHNGTASKCDACHIIGGPVRNCQSAGCHNPQFVNVDDHTTNRHQTTQISAASGQVFAGTGIASDACTGCHASSIDAEHKALSAYKATPCSICHRKTADSSAPTNVTAADVKAATAKSANSALCTDCHKTVSPTSVHVQRVGANGVAGGPQFDPTYSGHRVMSTIAGAKTGSFPAVTNTFSLPASDTAWLSTGWTPTSMVQCTDCHGSVTGATGPHGSAMKVNYAINQATGQPYDNSYTAGTLYNNGGTMSNTTNLCSKCHPANVLSQGGAPHTRSDHRGTSGGRCTNCHIPVPHVWKRPRLLGYTTDPAPYRTNALMGITSKNYTSGTWSQNDCATSCGGHNSTPAGTLWP